MKVKPSSLLVHKGSWLGCLCSYKISVFLSMFHVGNPFLTSWFTEYRGVAWLWHWRGSLFWGWIFKKLGTSFSVRDPAPGWQRCQKDHPDLSAPLPFPEAVGWTQAQREVWHLGRCVCGVELLLRDLCAPWAISASSARVKWCLGRPKAIGELLPLCYHRNIGLSEQQCSDTVGSSWLQYSTCTCVIYVTSAMFGHEFTCSGAKINFFWVFYGDFLASITLHVAFSGVTIFHPSESVVWQISFKCTTSYRSFCSNIHCYVKKANRGLGFCTYLNALNFVREPFKLPTALYHL